MLLIAFVIVLCFMMVDSAKQYENNHLKKGDKHD